MSEAIPLSAQDITHTDIDAVVSVLQSDRLSIGPWELIPARSRLAESPDR